MEIMASCSSYYPLCRSTCTGVRIDRPVTCFRSSQLSAVVAVFLQPVQDRRANHGIDGVLVATLSEAGCRQAELLPDP